MAQRAPQPSAADLRDQPDAASWSRCVVKRLLPATAERLPAEASATVPSSPLGDVDIGAVLERGPETETESATVSALLVLGLEHPLTTGDDAGAAAEALVRCSAAGPYDPLGALDSTLGPAADAAWDRLIEWLRPALAGAPDGTAPRLTPGELGVALAALASARSPAVRAGLAPLIAATESRVARRAVGVSLGPSGIAGVLTPGPRSALVTLLLAACGWLLATSSLRAIGRLALGWRRPATLTLTDAGLELQQQTLLLGRVLRERHTVFPRAGIRHVTREIKYQRAPLYAGVASLALGTYLGIGLFLDGARVPGMSLSLIGLGLLVIVAGLVLDFALTWLADLARGRCRLLLFPMRGGAIALSGLESEAADALLRRLGRELGLAAPETEDNAASPTALDRPDRGPLRSAASAPAATVADVAATDGPHPEPSSDDPPIAAPPAVAAPPPVTETPAFVAPNGTLPPVTETPVELTTKGDGPEPAGPPAATSEG